MLSVEIIRVQWRSSGTSTLEESIFIKALFMCTSIYAEGGGDARSSNRSMTVGCITEIIKQKSSRADRKALVAAHFRMEIFFFFFAFY